MAKKVKANKVAPLGSCENVAHRKPMMAIGTVYHPIWSGAEVEPSSGYPIALCAKCFMDEVKSWTESGFAVEVAPLRTNSTRRIVPVGWNSREEMERIPF